MTKGATPKRTVLALLGLIALGAVLRIWQYAGNTSLWVDEVALALGIIRTDFVSVLTAPLPYDQVAPKGFLLLEKLVVLALGPNDYALRLVPFACSLIALAAFARLATNMLEGVGPVAAVLMFATAAPLVAFSAVVKQYSTDVCAAVLLWLLAWELISRPPTRSRAVWGAFAGAILAWVSLPAVLMLAALGALLVLWPLLGSPRSKPPLRLLFIVAAWAVSVVGVTMAGLASMTSATREYLLRFFADGFPPEPLWRVLDVLWLWDRMVEFVGTGGTASFAYPLPAFYVLLAAAGIGALWHRQRPAAVILTAPLVLTLGAAIVKQYPFKDRLILFLAPVVILGIAAAVECVRHLARFSPVFGWVLVTTLLVPTVYPVVATSPVYVIEDMKPVLAYLQAKRRAEDSIYVYYGAAPVTMFYASQFGLNRGQYTVGGCHRGESRRYLKELDTFRGHARVWVLITHSIYYEREDILAYLDAIGSRQDSVVLRSRSVGWAPSPAEAYLYNLSDRVKAGRASSTTFTVTDPPSMDPRFNCDNGPQVLVPSDFQ